MPNPKPKTEHLSKRKSVWNNPPTITYRYPQVFKPYLDKFVRWVDAQEDPIEAIESVLKSINAG